jgi:hypothetical protein
LAHALSSYEKNESGRVILKDFSNLTRMVTPLALQQSLSRSQRAPASHRHRRHDGGRQLRYVGIIVALMMAAFGLGFALSSWLKPWRAASPPPLGDATLAIGAMGNTTTSLMFNHNSAAARARHLIVVAGHSVSVVSHIETGIALARDDPEALLVFSGGQTRPHNGPDSEAARYYRLADSLQLWWTTKTAIPHQTRNDVSEGNGHTHRSHTARTRTALEEYATDSFQNILFSIARFYEITGSYPNQITMISYPFKEWRFAQLHMTALHWPASQFRFVGVDVEPTRASTKLSAVEHQQSEQEQRRVEIEIAVPHFEADPYGCQSKVRYTKNPFFRTPPYALSCPELVDLLRYCGTELIGRDMVPW